MLSLSQPMRKPASAFASFTHRFIEVDESALPVLAPFHRIDDVAFAPPNFFSLFLLLRLLTSSFTFSKTSASTLIEAGTCSACRRALRVLPPKLSRTNRVGSKPESCALSEGDVTIFRIFHALSPFVVVAVAPTAATSRLEQ